MMGEVWERLRADAQAFPMMYGQGVRPMDIGAAERALGVRFDPNYVRFLSEYGGAMLGPEPLLGLSQADVMGSDSWSVIDVTRRFRNDGWAGVEDWYVVSIDGAGNPVGVAPDSAVYLSDHHGSGVIKLVNTFLEYLESRI